MSAISPVQPSPLSPISSRRIHGLYESVQSVHTIPVNSCRTVSLNLPPLRLTDSGAQSIQCYFKANPEERRKPAPILYKATSISNFIDFIFALHAMKANEVSHVIALDLSFFTHSDAPNGFEKFYSLLQQKCPFIREIIWGNNLPVNDNFFEFLKGFPNLTRLNLSNCCDKINDEHLKQLAKSIPNLTDLNLSGCDLVTNNGISYLSLFKHLKHLNLSYLDQVTDESLRAMKSLKGLKYIDLFNTSVSDDFIYYLKMEMRENGLKVQFEQELFIFDYYDDVFQL